ncbi:hypothetical protein AB0425_23445 [Actinosynnema sp. NPDC051121]
MSGLEIMHTRVPAMAWCRHDGDDDFIYWSPGTTVVGPEVRWPEPRVLRDRRSSGSPTISGSGPGALMAWKGSGGDTRIWFSEWDTAVGTWGPQNPTPFETHHSPTLVRYRDNTFLFFRDVPPHDVPQGQMVWARYANGRWVDPVNPDPEDTTLRVLEFVGAKNVSATWYTHLNATAIAWEVATGVEGAEVLQREARFAVMTERSFDSGEGRWDPAVVNGAVVAATPALTSDGNVMHMAWREPGVGTIWWAWSAGGPWLFRRPLPDRATSATPALAAIGMGDVVMVWKGIQGDPRMWWSRLRDNVWSPQQPFTDSQHEMHTDTWASMF